MTTSQLSFSAFAATQTDPGNFAVSDQSGLRGCFLPKSDKFNFTDSFKITGSTPPIMILRDGFDWDCGDLDAPNYLAQGSVYGFNDDGQVIAVSQVFRG